MRVRLFKNIQLAVQVHIQCVSEGCDGSSDVDGATGPITADSLFPSWESNVVTCICDWFWHQTMSRKWPETVEDESPFRLNFSVNCSSCVAAKDRLPPSDRQYSIFVSHVRN